MLILALVTIVIGVNAQISIWSPIPKNVFDNPMYKAGLLSGQSAGDWFVRWQTGVIATSYGKNKLTGNLETVPFSAVGVGVGYQHYKDNNGVAFNDYGAEALLLKNAQSNGMGLGIYVNYSLVNIGSHYDFMLKQFFFDTGVQLHF